MTTTGHTLSADLPLGRVYDAVRALDVLFGRGVDDDPLWLLVVRLNVLVALGCAVAATLWRLSRHRGVAISRREAVLVAGLTAVAAGLRFGLATPNLMDFGGIPFSRLLHGYKGHFATAQFYSIFYQLTARDIEHAILFDQIAGTLTVPLVYALCRNLSDGWRWPAIAAALFALCPLHIVFSASDSLATFSIFLAAGSYALLTWRDPVDDDPVASRLRYAAGFAGLALLTQVRYENALFVVPAYALLALRRGEADRRSWLTSAVVAALCIAYYGYEASTSGLTFQNPIRVPQDIAMVIAMVLESVVLNPFVAVPALLVANIGIFASRGPLWGAVSLMPWVPALVLPVIAGSGHGAARVFASWLILILPTSGYGIYLLVSSSHRWGRTMAVALLAFLAVQPVVFRERIATRHLEIGEYQFLRAALAALPVGIEYVIVPDDELMRRATHSTIELRHKYEMTLAAVRDADPADVRVVELVGLTDYLERPERTGCGDARCAFFFGLPCLEQDVHPLVREQCLEMRRSRRLSVIDESSMLAAPFLHCGIYVDALAVRHCEPATMLQRFLLYRVDGSLP